MGTRVVHIHVESSYWPDFVAQTHRAADKCCPGCVVCCGIEFPFARRNRMVRQTNKTSMDRSGWRFDPMSKNICAVNVFAWYFVGWSNDRTTRTGRNAVEQNTPVFRVRCGIVSLNIMIHTDCDKLGIHLRQALS